MLNVIFVVVIVFVIVYLILLIVIGFVFKKCIYIFLGDCSFYSCLIFLLGGFCIFCGVFIVIFFWMLGFIYVELKFVLLVVLVIFLIGLCDDLVLLLV